MTKDTTLVINGGEVITPAETFRAGRIVIKDGRIAAVGARGKIRAPKGAQTISARGKKVLPGLIATHAHGLCGTDCREGAEAIINVRRNLPRFGVTGFLPTLFCVDSRDLDRHLSEVRTASHAPCDGAQVLGVHLEGPYFNPEFGAFPQLGRPIPTPKAQERMIQQYRGLVKLVTLSPELRGAPGFIRKLKANGIIAAIGHSGATEKQFAKAVEAGASHVIHMFNAMRRRSHEEPGCEWPGLSDLVLLEDRLNAELIVDGIHVKPPLLKLIVRAKGVERLILITDSMKAAGMKPGRYQLWGGLEVVSDGRSCRDAEGVLAGSLLTLNRAVINMSRMAGVPLPQAVQMATMNPARLIGVHWRKGGLDPGKDADICIADEHMRVEMTIVKGKVVYVK